MALAVNYSHAEKSIQPEFQKKKKMRKNTAGPGSESLTPCQVNTIRVPGRGFVRRGTARPGTCELLTHCEVNTIRVPGSRIMRKDTTGPGNESLTNCQVNAIRVTGKRIMMSDVTGLGSESLTSCQCNTTRVSGRRIIGSQLDLGVNHSHPVKSIQPVYQVEKL